MKIGSMIPVVVMLLAAALFAAPEDARMSAAAGVVASIDHATSSLTVKLNVKGEPREVTFVVNSDSKIVKSSSAIALAELKQGDKVTVTYRSEGGKNVVVNIGVESRM